MVPFEIIFNFSFFFLFQRNVQAKDIFNKHLSVHALEPVNIDSVARQQADSQLDIPTPQIFDVAQHQVRMITFAEKSNLWIIYSFSLV
jgi:hypothetical protein